MYTDQLYFARRDRSALDADKTFRPENKVPSNAPRFKASRTYCLNVFPEARTSEILCKTNAGTKSPLPAGGPRGRPAAASARASPIF